VGFSPEGLYVLTGSQDNTARLWEAVSGKLVGPALKQGRSVWSAVRAAVDPCPPIAVRETKQDSTTDLGFF
jgi:WD40 repeat protein